MKNGLIKFIKGVFPVTLTKAIYFDGTNNTLQSAIDRGEIATSVSVENRFRIINETDTLYNIPRGGVQYDSDSVFCMYGDSLAYSDNGWFEIGCELLGVKPLNKAESGHHIQWLADRMKNGTAWTPSEFEKITHLCLAFTHPYDVFDESLILKDWRDYEPLFPLYDGHNGASGRCWDYVIRKYMDECYNQRLVEGSKWFGTPHGKPVQIIINTYWHDVRTIYNYSVRKLCAKWKIPLVAFDEQIGFTMHHPILLNDGTQYQVSRFYAVPNGVENTETVDGQVFGWHMTRGKTEYIQKKMGKIFADTIGM